MTDAVLTLNEAQRATWLGKIKEGFCPICGAGPYRSIGIHINKTHGLTRFVVRDALSITTRTPLCQPDVSEACRERAVAEGLHILGNAAPRPASRRRATAAMHAYNARRRAEMVDLVCVACGVTFRQSARVERQLARRRKGGPRCSATCRPSS